MIKYTFEDAENLVSSIVLTVQPGREAPIENYRKALKEGKKPLEAIHLYLEVDKEKIWQRYTEREKAICLQIKKILVCPFDKLPLYINSTVVHLLKGRVSPNSLVGIKDIVVWRLKNGK